MLSLPNSEIYVWLRWNRTGKQIADEIINLLGFQPYEKSVNQGICDLRWEAKDFDSAVRLAENLKYYLDAPEVILGRVLKLSQNLILSYERSILSEGLKTDPSTGQESKMS